MCSLKPSGGGLHSQPVSVWMSVMKAVVVYYLLLFPIEGGVVGAIMVEKYRPNKGMQGTAVNRQPLR